MKRGMDAADLGGTKNSRREAAARGCAPSLLVVTSLTWGQPDDERLGFEETHARRAPMAARDQRPARHGYSRDLRLLQDMRGADPPSKDGPSHRWLSRPRCFT